MHHEASVSHPSSKPFLHILHPSGTRENIILSKLRDDNTMMNQCS